MECIYGLSTMTLSFNGSRPHRAKTKRVIWEGFLDYIVRSNDGIAKHAKVDKRHNKVYHFPGKSVINR